MTGKIVGVAGLAVPVFEGEENDITWILTCVH